MATMHEVALVIVPAPLGRDSETCRWYSEGADVCLVLTRRRRLLEPLPVFGPTSYRLIALRASKAEASAYARARGLHHERPLPSKVSTA